MAFTRELSHPCGLSCAGPSGSAGPQAKGQGSASGPLARLKPPDWEAVTFSPSGEHADLRCGGGDMRGTSRYRHATSRLACETARGRIEDSTFESPFSAWTIRLVGDQNCTLHDKSRGVEHAVTFRGAADCRCWEPPVRTCAAKGQPASQAVVCRAKPSLPRSWTEFNKTRDPVCRGARGQAVPCRGK